MQQNIHKGLDVTKVEKNTQKGLKKGNELKKSTQKRLEPAVTGSAVRAVRRAVWEAVMPCANIIVIIYGNICIALELSLF